MVESEAESKGRGLFARIVTTSNLTFLMTVAAFVWATVYFFVDMQYVVVSAQHSDPVYLADEHPDAYDVYDLPVEYVVQNLSDGPIKVTYFLPGFSEANGPGCEKEMGGFGKPQALEAGGFVEAGGKLVHSQSVAVPRDLLPQRLCLAVVWRSQSGSLNNKIVELGTFNRALPTTGNALRPASYIYEGGWNDMHVLKEKTYCMPFSNGDKCW